jgi:hypothetical protein
VRSGEQPAAAVFPLTVCTSAAARLPASTEASDRRAADAQGMTTVQGKLKAWRQARIDRKRRDMQAQHARTYVARDGRGRVIASR